MERIFDQFLSEIIQIFERIQSFGHVVEVIKEIQVFFMVFGVWGLFDDLVDDLRDGCQRNGGAIVGLQQHLQEK